MLLFLTQIGSVIAFAKRYDDRANGFCGPETEMGTSLHNYVTTTERNRHMKEMHLALSARRHSRL